MLPTLILLIAIRLMFPPEAPGADMLPAEMEPLEAKIVIAPPEPLPKPALDRLPAMSTEPPEINRVAPDAPPTAASPTIVPEAILTVEPEVSVSCPEGWIVAPALVLK